MNVHWMQITVPGIEKRQYTNNGTNMNFNTSVEFTRVNPRFIGVSVSLSVKRSIHNCLRYFKNFMVGAQ